MHEELRGLDVGSDGYQDAHERAHAREIQQKFANRTATTPFDIVAEGKTPGDRPDEAAAIARDWAEAGATWWIEALWGAESVETVRQRVEQGPPRLP